MLTPSPLRQLRADPVSRPIELLPGRTELLEQPLRHRRGYLALRRHHHGRSSLLQRHDLAHMARAAQEMRVEILRLADHRVGGVGGREDEGKGISDSGALQDLALRGVSIDGVNALLVEVGDGIVVELDDGGHEALLAQEPRQGSADGAIADDDCPRAGVGGRGGGRRGDP